MSGIVPSMLLDAASRLAPDVAALVLELVHQLLTLPAADRRAAAERALAAAAMREARGALHQRMWDKLRGGGGK